MGEDVIREVAEVFDHPAHFHLGLDEANFDQVPTGSTCWGNSKGAQETMELLRNECAPWRFTCARDVYDLMNDAARLGQGMQVVYPELCR